MGLFNFFHKKSPKQEAPSLQPKQAVQVNVTVSDPEIPSLPSLLSTAVPSGRGLYPHEILMLQYAPAYKTTGNTFQRFWLYEYGVQQPQKILDALLNRNFLCVGGIKETLQNQTVASLKGALSEIGAKTTGKKDSLIEQLLETWDRTALESKYPERYFALTESGQQELRENEYVPYLHKKKYMSVWEMNKLLRNTGYSPSRYRDLLWGEFNRQSLDQMRNLNFGLYRNTRLNMYSFLMEENQYKPAFTHLCEVLFIDLSGLGNGETALFSKDARSRCSNLEIKLRFCFPYEKSSARMLPGFKDDLLKLQDRLGLDNTGLKNALSAEFEKCSLPYHIFTVAECVGIVMGELDNRTEQVEKIYRTAEMRLKKEYQSLR